MRYRQAAEEVGNAGDVEEGLDVRITPTQDDIQQALAGLADCRTGERAVTIECAHLESRRGKRKGWVHRRYGPPASATA